MTHEVTLAKKPRKVAIYFDSVADAARALNVSRAALHNSQKGNRYRVKGGRVRVGGYTRAQRKALRERYMDISKDSINASVVSTDEAAGPAWLDRYGQEGEFHQGDKVYKDEYFVHDYPPLTVEEAEALEALGSPFGAEVCCKADGRCSKGCSTCSPWLCLDCDAELDGGGSCPACDVTDGLRAADDGGGKGEV